jgi:hypothetical protein
VKISRRVRAGCKTLLTLNPSLEHDKPGRGAERLRELECAKRWIAEQIRWAASQAG